MKNTTIYCCLILVIISWARVINSLPRPIAGIVGRNRLDIYDTDENDDDMTDVDIYEQEKLIQKAFLACMTTIANTTNNTSPEYCPSLWDTILCWSQTLPEQTVYQPCPKYINKMNIKNNAVKYCRFNNVTNKAEWSKTNFTPCLELTDEIQEQIMISNSMTKHVAYAYKIRITAFCLSIASIFLAGLILSRKRMRCPRNFIHLNLFIAFSLQAIMALLIEILNNKTDMFRMQSNMTQLDYEEVSLTKYLNCRIIWTIYRYFHSVYTSTITTEAVYLTLLLSFPYYSEKKGSKFCIIISWLLPISWIVAWVLARVFISGSWCWQTESLLNLIINIPHTLLTVINLLCAAFIIRTLYSKIKTNQFSLEKIQKYRHLAKSILIIIPVFGIHFVIFEWLPYFRYATDESLAEIPIIYIEVIFNWFQGVLMAIACCFIQRDAQIEFCLLLHKILAKLRCLRFVSCLKCANEDYIRTLRFSRSKMSMGYVTTAHSQADLESKSNRRRMSEFQDIESLAGGNRATTSKKSPHVVKKRDQSTSSSNKSHRIGGGRSSKPIMSLICPFLFSSHKNDFYQSKKSSSSFHFNHHYHNQTGSRTINLGQSVPRRMSEPPQPTITSMVASINSSLIKPARFSVSLVEEKRRVSIREANEELIMNELTPLSSGANEQHVKPTFEITDEIITINKD